MCTANINRSPMAAALLEARLAELGLEGRATSAGLLEGGQPASPEAVAVLAGRGVDLSAHVSRQLSTDAVVDADLVLGMERRHMRAAAVLGGDSMHKSFTIKEFLRRALEAGQRQPGEALGAWLDRVGVGRDPVELAGDDDADAVADPVGGTLQDYQLTIEELDLLVRGVSYFVWEGASLPGRMTSDQSAPPSPSVDQVG